jgi:UDP-GlcNAc3NAcA epimerase
MKIVTIIGARPQIIKAAALSRAVRTHYQGIVEEIIVHTGQHYDNNMSEVFFEELQIPRPDFNLGVGSESHGIQTARMTEGIEKILLETRPDCIVLYGDTNSTLAGAVAASKIQVPVVHIEAGLRSFNKIMPEELNRIICDHCSTLLFSPTLTGYNNLLREGFNPMARPPYHINNPKIYHCGDIMYDNSLYFKELANKQSNILDQLQVNSNGFILATIHRNTNTDEPDRLAAILQSILQIVEDEGIHVILPLHPRTAKMLDKLPDRQLREKFVDNAFIHIIPPVSFLDMVALEQHAYLIMTDSGGVQKEAYFYRKPCIILRPETEWKEIVTAGAAIIADADKQLIADSWKYFRQNPVIDYQPIFGDGHAAEFILNEMLACFGS